VLDAVKPPSHTGSGSAKPNDAFTVASSQILSLCQEKEDMSHRGKQYTQESAGSGSFSSSGDRICYCGLQAPIRVSKSEANPGREYYSCPTRRCRWFMWAEPAGNCSGRLGSQTRE
ncbi:hypothetical protein PIB30_091249, partial [Stylosanthes scabra]|nr:hypothetical protein [Stylosanthes scabra]